MGGFRQRDEHDSRFRFLCSGGGTHTHRTSPPGGISMGGGTGKVEPFFAEYPHRTSGNAVRLKMWNARLRTPPASGPMVRGGVGGALSSEPGTYFQGLEWQFQAAFGGGALWRVSGAL
jgi:hypothetical protein